MLEVQKENLKKLSLMDLKKFISVIDPQLSYDSKKIAFTVVKIDESRDEYKTEIHIIDSNTGEPLNYLSSGRDLWPRWSKDSKKILFLSKRLLKEGEKGSELWVKVLSGEEPRLIYHSTRGIENPIWSPDGKKIYFLSSVGEDEEDVKVIRRIPIWFNGVGFTYNKRKHLFEVDVASGLVKQLTDGEINVSYFSLSNDGERIAYLAACDDYKPIIIDIFILNLNNKRLDKVTDSNMFVSSVGWSPNDEYLTFRGHNLRQGFSTHEIIWILSALGGKPEDLTSKLDRGSTRRIYYDLRSPYAYMYAPLPSWDGNYLYFPLSDGGRLNIYRLSLSNQEVEPVVKGNFLVEDFCVRNGKIAYLKVTETEPAEIWIRDNNEDRKLTNYNQELLSSLKLYQPEQFSCKVSDGEVVEGWFIKPSDFNDNQKYPVILNIHGGPKSVFGYAFMFEHQLWASEGYVVLYFNPRGSDGYSEKFAEIRKNYGNRDYKDIIETLDYFIDNYEFVDPQKIAVTGISYGGFMTNWLVTHSNRFRAAISQNGISNWIAEYGNTDIGFYFVPDQIGGEPWTNEEGYRVMSPLTYADKVNTPIMFIHSFEDYRCWIDQSLSFYTALKHLKKDTEMILFMKGEHVFSRTGKPSHRIKRLEHILRWFKEYL